MKNGSVCLAQGIVNHKLKPISDFNTILSLIRGLHEEQAAHRIRIQRLERKLLVSDTGPLKERVLPHEVLADVFDEFELKVFSTQLKIDYETLDGDNKLEKALSLVLYMQRRGKFQQLLDMAQEERAHIDWSQFSKGSE